MTCPVPSPTVSLASELYAISQGSKCEGDSICHWCGAPCKRIWPHDEPPVMIIQPGIRKKTLARHPANAYICVGCWLWRKKRISVRFLDGSLKDCQAPINHSWWITQEGAWSLNEVGSLVFEILLAPPLKFVLALTDKTSPNHLQHAVLTSKTEILAETPLEFTFNSTPHFYSIYELTEALITNDLTGKSSGVNVLMSTFGPAPEKLVNELRELRNERLKKEEWQEKRGRPEPVEDARILSRKIR